MADLNKACINKVRYGAIDGLRTFAALGIVFMHVLSNGEYAVSGFVFEKMIPSLTDLVFLFMIVSGFSVCYGYYDRIMSGNVSLDVFYRKRFERIWPFFACWCFVDLAISPSLNALCEVAANLTLCFGLLPNANISVIGVGWFLGVVFVFYMIFPFVCWLLETKRRAWTSFGIAFLLNKLCSLYFDVGRTSIAYCGVFFLAGGLIFLYKDQLATFVSKHRLIVALGIVGMAVVYYTVGSYVTVMLALFVLMLIYALDSEGKYRILDNCITKFGGKISMEVYLCHMVAFRVLEKAGLTHLFASEGLSFVATAIGTVIGAILLSIATNCFLKMIGAWKKRVCRECV